MFAYTLGNSMDFVDRGDPNTDADYTKNTLDLDNVWNALDLSAIIPKDTKLVMLSVMAYITEGVSVFACRKNGNINERNMATLFINATMTAYYKTFFVAPKDGIIEYKASPANFIICDLVIRGWWK